MRAPVNFFFDFVSQPSRALYIIFKVSGSNVQDIPVALRKEEHLTEKFRTEVNRFQKVPCIVDGDYKLSESIAILRYMQRKGEIKDSLYPQDSYKELSKVDEFLEWQHLTLRKSCESVFRMKWLDPIRGIERHEDDIEESQNIMDFNLDIIENVWLKDNTYLAGESLTAADIFGACEMEQTKLFGYNAAKNRPLIEAWLEKVREATNPHYNEAHAFVHKASRRHKVFVN